MFATTGRLSVRLRTHPTAKNKIMLLSIMDAEDDIQCIKNYNLWLRTDHMSSDFVFL